MSVASFNAAIEADCDVWVPACGGTEVPFRARSGVVLLYCFNPALKRHAYIDVRADVVLEDAVAFAHLGTV